MRFARRKTKPHRSTGASQINVGFLPTIDCAVLIAAQELGLFERHGLKVRLTREVGWATIREKLLHEELDAAAAHASMLFSIYCGVGGVRRQCLTGLLLGLNGSAITLSNKLWDEGVRDAPSFGDLVRRSRGQRVFTLGMVLTHSSQNYYLRQWLRQGGLDPDKDVRSVVIPSNLVYDSFREGHLDGFCVADPWNSMAVFERTGWVVAATSEIEHHPEKVLLVLNEFAEDRAEEHLRLIAALMEASVFCDRPENRRGLARMLAQSRYFDLNAEYLENALIGPFDCGQERRAIPDFVMFDGWKYGSPSRARGKWVLDMVRSLSHSGPLASLRSDTIARVFREDIYKKAKRLCRPDAAGNLQPQARPAPGVPPAPAQPLRAMGWPSLEHLLAPGAIIPAALAAPDAPNNFSEALMLH